MESHAQAGVTMEKGVQRPVQPLGVDGAIEFEDELHQVRIFAFAVVVGVEEQSFL